MSDLVEMEGGLVCEDEPARRYYYYHQGKLVEWAGHRAVRLAGRDMLRVIQWATAGLQWSCSLEVSIPT